MTLLASLAGIAGGLGGGSVPTGDTTSVSSPFNQSLNTGNNVFAPIGDNPNLGLILGGANPLTLSSDPQSLSGAVSRTAIPVVLIGVAGLVLISFLKKGRK